MRLGIQSTGFRGLTWLALVWFALAGEPQVGRAALSPPTLGFDGRVLAADVPFTGTGQFKFALLGQQGSPAATVVVWSNDGTSVGDGTEPASAVSLPVNKGLYSVRLGDTNLPNMTTTIGVGVVTNQGLQLRVWFNDGVHGVQLLSPDQTLASVAYARAAERADTAREAESLSANQNLSGLTTFAGNVVLGTLGATDRLNVEGNIRLANDGTIYGLDRLVGYNDLRLFGDAGSLPDLYIAANGWVGIGTDAPTARLTVDGADNNGTTGTLRLQSGEQYMVLDGNEIDSNQTLYLQYNLSGSIVLANGGGNVSIGSLPADERLVVQGNIRVADDSSIRGLHALVGYNDLHFYGDSTAGPDLSITPQGHIGQRVVYSNVAFNIRGDVFAGETQYLRVEDFFGISVLEIQSDRDVAVDGDFFVSSGSKNFVIDHPQAPGEKELRHNTVEGPGYYTFYHGRVELDANGEAWVELPSYFEALNTQPQYQLTCVGGYAPVYVAEEVVGNRFKIGGGRAGLKVCWQVTANRNDPYARDHPYQAEVEKTAEERGTYYYPHGYGAGYEKALNRVHTRAESPAAPLK